MPYLEQYFIKIILTTIPKSVSPKVQYTQHQRLLGRAKRRTTNFPSLLSYQLWFYNIYCTASDRPGFMCKYVTGSYQLLYQYKINTYALESLLLHIRICLGNSRKQTALKYSPTTHTTDWETNSILNRESREDSPNKKCSSRYLQN